MRTRNNNREGSIRKLGKDSYECLIQSKYFNENGNLKRIKRRGKTQEEAQKNAQIALRKFEKEYETNIKQNNTPVLNSKDNFKKYIFYYLDNIVKQKIAASTYYNYNNTLKMLSKAEIFKIQIKSLNRNDFEKFFLYVSNKYSDGIVKNIFIFFRGFCDWLCNDNIIEENYVRMIIPKKEVNVVVHANMVKSYPYRILN